MPLRAGIARVRIQLQNPIWIDDPTWKFFAWNSSNETSSLLAEEPRHRLDSPCQEPRHACVSGREECLRAAGHLRQGKKTHSGVPRTLSQRGIGSKENRY